MRHQEWIAWQEERDTRRERRRGVRFGRALGRTLDAGIGLLADVAVALLLARVLRSWPDPVGARPGFEAVLLAMTLLGARSVLVLVFETRITPSDWPWISCLAALTTAPFMACVGDAAESFPVAAGTTALHLAGICCCSAAVAVWSETGAPGGGAATLFPASFEHWVWRYWRGQESARGAADPRGRTARGGFAAARVKVQRFLAQRYGMQEMTLPVPAGRDAGVARRAACRHRTGALPVGGSAVAGCANPGSCFHAAAAIDDPAAPEAFSPAPRVRSREEIRRLVRRTFTPVP